MIVTSHEKAERAKKKNREEKARVQAEAQDRMTVLRHGGAPPLEAESEGGRRRFVSTHTARPRKTKRM